MELPVTDDQEARLREIALREGKSVTEVILQAAESLLVMDAEHWAAVEHALAQANRGEFIEEEEMDRRLARMLA